MFFLNSIKNGNITEMKIAHMETFLKYTNVYLETEKGRENTRGHFGSGAEDSPLSSERLKSPSVYLTAEFDWNMH